MASFDYRILAMKRGSMAAVRTYILCQIIIHGNHASTCSIPQANSKDQVKTICKQAFYVGKNINIPAHMLSDSAKEFSISSSEATQVYFFM